MAECRVIVADALSEGSADAFCVNGGAKTTDASCEGWAAADAFCKNGRARNQCAQIDEIVQETDETAQRPTKPRTGRRNRALFGNYSKTIFELFAYLAIIAKQFLKYLHI